MFLHPPDIVLGPPGTGKTTTLLGVLREELAAGTPPDRIGFVTFTRRAAQEAQARVLAEFGLTKKDTPYFRTLHSLAMRASGLSGNNILQGEKVSAFAEWIGEEIRGRVSVDGTWSGYARGDRLMFMVNLARIRRVPLRTLYEETHDDLDWVAVDRFDRALRDYKLELGLHDFSDMLERAVARGVPPALDVLLVDEAQDQSLLQWDVVYWLARGCRRVVVAGDDDQGIFAWAGADSDTLIDMPGRARVLAQSYRVPRAVQAVANGVIGRVQHRRPKQWQPREQEGTVRWVRDLAAAGLEGESVMVLARNRHQLDPIEQELRAAGIMYEREDQPSVKCSVLDAIVTWERLRRGEAQRVGAVVTGPYAQMSVGVGVRRGQKKLPNFAPERLVSLEDLKSEGGLLREDPWHAALDQLPAADRIYIQRCRRNKERLTTAPRVRLSTIHGSKGGEADRVILLTDMAPRTWRESHANPDAERRVLYVGMTRAREELCLIKPTTSRFYEI
jgi:DNA helicase-2/ATP-dependent DNA helicase PcrA